MNTMNSPKVDEKWELLFQLNSYAAFANIVPNIFIKSTVHVDIQSHVRIIQNLMYAAYYEYEFVDVAYTQALLTVEMALRIRFKDITGEAWGRRSLQKLIAWFLERHYFEIEHPELYEHLRWSRNFKMHPEMHSFGGPTYFHPIVSFIDLINDLYEDVELRQERHREIKRIIEFIAPFNERGAIVKTKDGREVVIYWIIVDFLNNKVHPPRISLTYRTTFVIPADYQPGHCVLNQPAYSLDCNKLTYSNGLLSGLSGHDEPLFTISEIPEGSQRDKFGDWRQQYDQYSAATMYHISIAHDYANRFLPLLREFHKM